MDTLEGYYQGLRRKVNRDLTAEEEELLRQRALEMYDDAPFGGTMKSVKMSHKPSEYEDGSIHENIEKTGQLSALAKMDPAMDRTISKFTNQFVARAANSAAWQPSKDLYALGQDAYLLEMGRAGLLGQGVRNAKQRARG
jgi:hypothetical protein